MADPETVAAAEALLDHPCLRHPASPEDQRLALELHRWLSHHLKADLTRDAEQH